MGFTALKTKIATLKAPYDNDYLNKNFNLNMLAPSSNKEDIFKNHMKKMILSTFGNEITYKNLDLYIVNGFYQPFFVQVFFVLPSALAILTLNFKEVKKMKQRTMKGGTKIGLLQD